MTMSQRRLALWQLFHFFLTLLSLTQGLTYVPPPVREQRSCCYGDASFPHGDVVLSIPQICLQLVCDDGKIEHRLLEGTEEEGYLKNVRCCEFDGKMYPNGAKLTSHCTPMVCKDGSWIPAGFIDDCCNHCYIHDDPHVYTFDGYQYDWHGVCNYSVAQSDSTYYPDVAVFSDFVACYGRASCLAHTTFRNDPHTVITLFNGAVFDLLVNGHPFHVLPGKVQAVKSSSGVHPVLAWRVPLEDDSAKCIILFGSSRLVLLHCPHRLDVWVHRSHSDSLDGLCGHFNFYVNDDFTNRDGQVHQLHRFPLAFPSSWRTDTQIDYECRAPCSYCHEETTDSPCNVTAYELERFTNACKEKLSPLIGKRIELNTHIETCTFDLCMLSTSGGDSAAIDSWLLQLEENLEITIYILDKTEDVAVDCRTRQRCNAGGKAQKANGGTKEPDGSYDYQ